MSMLNLSGEIDLQMISKINTRYPGVPIKNVIVEPSPEQIISYKARIAKTPNIDNITFSWNNITAIEFEEQVDKVEQKEKYDFVHMIQMLYYVKDVPGTLSFFKSCLAPKGKLMITLVSGNNGWSTLWKKYSNRLPLQELTAAHIMEILSSMGARYQSYELLSDMDITECFIEGNRNGELLLDFLTATCDFKSNAPAELRDEIINDLKTPECSSHRDGKVIFNNNFSVIVVESD
ncbi:hypothetical protein GDO86_016794 [Hymenochirus boettgeri]|uniref:Histamine N-methyltransferase n=1 Tax=Hymenochirus boettgeri TaxID=247094 RepID=A0A8T2IJU9_9PIPI|nr:hypothetical protein GDO86_016794 [Hymenochirus boettgeri]